MKNKLPSQDGFWHHRGEGAQRPCWERGGWGPGNYFGREVARLPTLYFFLRQHRKPFSLNFVWKVWLLALTSQENAAVRGVRHCWRQVPNNAPEDEWVLKGPKSWG
jgi:hypothetical protein